MKQIEAPYAEKRLQLAAVEWMAATGRYVETFSDVEATGARMDSVGILDSRATTIEVKVSVSAPMVRFRPDASGSLEAKIAATLRALREPIPDRLNAFRTHWEPSRFPIIVMLARSYSNTGLTELAAMLRERSEQWQFAFEIWRWTGTEIEVLASNVGQCADRLRQPDIVVPDLIGSAKRAGARTLVELREIAALAGLEVTFDAFVEGAKSRGLTILRKRTGLSLTHKAAGAQRLTLFVVGSGPEGFNTGIDADWLGLDPAALPGQPAPRNGYMNTNRFIRTPEEAAVLLDLLSIRLANDRLSAP